MITRQTSKAVNPQGDFMRLLVIVVANWLGMPTVSIDGEETGTSFAREAKERKNGKISVQLDAVAGFVRWLQGIGNTETAAERENAVIETVKAFRGANPDATVKKLEVVTAIAEEKAKKDITSKRENGRNAADILKRLHGVPVGTGEALVLTDERYDKIAKAFKAITGYKHTLFESDVTEGIERMSALLAGIKGSSNKIESLSLAVTSPVSNYVPLVPAMEQLGADIPVAQPTTV